MGPFLQPIADYYADTVSRHGASPRGADWNSASGQLQRFSELLKVTPPGTNDFTLDDYGCGYGALFDHLRNSVFKVDYLGLDISSRMIEEAKAQHSADANRFVLGPVSPRCADFAVASGIFNVRLGAPTADWERHILTTLDTLNSASFRGFAFNCLSDYSDPPFRKDYLYYGNPGFYFDLCMRRYGGKVSLLHDYGLYEFTILVRKQPGA